MADRTEQLPFNAAARNAVWSYPREVKSPFAGAPLIIETAHAHKMPDFARLPTGAEVEVQLYGGAVHLRMSGERRRVYIEKFVHYTYQNEASARAAFLSLWQEVKQLTSASEVAAAAREWLAQQAADGG